MDVFGLGIRIKEEGAATVSASIKRLGGELARTALSVGAVVATLNKFVKETMDAQAEQAALVSVLQSTNAVSGQTIDTLNEHAEALQKVTAFSGGAIAETQALLLTFTNIRGTFREATEAALDLAQRFTMDVKSAAMMVGKALNDPVSGLTALNKAGVQFSPVQKQMIEQFIQQNDVMGAQKIILAELNTQVGGAAEAYRKTLGGALQGVKNAFDDLFEISAQDAQGLVNALNALAEWLPKFRDDLNVTAAYWDYRFSQMGKMVLALTMHLDMARFVFLKFMDTVHREGPKEIPALTQARKQIQDSLREFQAYDKKIEDALANLGRAYSAQGMAKAPTPLATPMEATGGGGKTDNVDKERLQRLQEGAMAAAARRQAIDAELKTVEEAFSKLDIYSGRFARGLSGGELWWQNIPQSILNALPVIVDATKKLAEDIAVQVPPLDTALLRAMRIDILKETLADGIRNAIESGIMAGMEMAIASGRIGDAFRAMGQAIVRSMASAMVRVAMEAIKLGSMLDRIREFMILHPKTAVITAIAMLALARSLGGGVGGGAMTAVGGPGGLSYGVAGAVSPAQQIIFGATSATTAAGMTPRQSMNVTIIGPNDPTAQRAIQELMTKAESRGRIG